MIPRFPKHLAPLLAAALACLALMSPGNGRGVRSPLPLQGALVLTENLQRRPAPDASPMQPFAWSVSAAPEQSGQAVPLPDVQGWAGALQRDSLGMPGNAAALTPPAPERPGRDRRRNALLLEPDKDDGLALPDLGAESGWGWLAEDLRPQSKAASQNEPARREFRDEFRDAPDDPFTSMPLDDSFGLERRRTFTLD
jgi:hypothetical protein